MNQKTKKPSSQNEEGYTLNKQEIQVLRYFKNNARDTLTKASRKTGIPASTIYDILQRLENTGCIEFHTKITNKVMNKEEV